MSHQDFVWPRPARVGKADGCFASLAKGLVILLHLLAILFLEYYLGLDVGFICIRACTKFMNVV